MILCSHRKMLGAAPGAAIWRAAQPFVDADKLVFIDETGA
jgi:hypothetical protein